jgi:ATP synthase protein I
MTQGHSIPPGWADQVDGEQESDFKPLTRDEAQQWRVRQPVLSLWRLVLVQWLVGLAAGIVGGLLWQSSSVARRRWQFPRLSWPTG